MKNFFLFAQVKSISKVPNKNKKPEVESETESTGEEVDMRKVKEKFLQPKMCYKV